MSAYYDDRKKKYVVSTEAGQRKEFPENPSMMDYASEGFQDSDTRAQLEAVRKRRKPQGT